MHLELSCVLLNVENLFLLLDEEPKQSFATMNEKAWQSLSSSIIKNKPLQKVKELSEAMLDIGADIFLLVEVGGEESLRNFSEYFLGDGYETLLIEGNSDRAIDVGFLVRRELRLKAEIKTNKNRKLKFLYEHEKMSMASGYNNLVKRIGARFSRDVAELHLRLNGSLEGIDLIFLLTHLKSKREGFQFDPQGAAKRQAELRGLIEIFKERDAALGGQTPIFVCGDLNGNASRFDTEKDFKKIYEDTDLEDLFELFNRPEEERITFHHIRGKQRHDQQLDYVFLARRFKSILVEPPYIYEYKMPGSARKRTPPSSVPDKQRFPADHYPYVFKVRLDPKHTP